VDIFLVMSQDFNVEDYTDATWTVFPHAQAERDLGASVFWAYERINQSTIEDLLEGWRTTRDNRQRGIV
jgi:hypothetical protein